MKDEARFEDHHGLGVEKFPDIRLYYPFLLQPSRNYSRAIDVFITSLFLLNELALHNECFKILLLN